MENNKPEYHEVEKELNEYKQLLWQLSDEYRLNLGKAEKELTELKNKYSLLEKQKSVDSPTTAYSFISQIGLPACIIEHDGRIIKYNNKFKFLVELLSFEIEDVENLTFLLVKDKVNKLSEKFFEYVSNDEGIFQSTFKVKNAFQNVINILLRIYRFEEQKESLALFVEINNQEISNLTEFATPGRTEETKEIPENEEAEEEIEEEIEEAEIVKKEPTNDEDLSFKTDIEIFAEKYEVYSDLIKIYSSKDKKNQEIEAKEIRKNITDTFNLETTRTKLLDKISTKYKSFMHNFSEKYEDLTPNEEKHCLLIKAGLTYREIASLMDISINGVKIARNRLRKKLDLETAIKTSDFIDEF